MVIIGRRFTVGTVEYEIVQEINSGGFGTLYLAKPLPPSSPSLLIRKQDSSLAVKAPADHVFHDDEWLRRFKREARILSNILHPNVVRTHGLLEYPDGAVAIVQEFLENA